MSTLGSYKLYSRAGRTYVVEEGKALGSELTTQLEHLACLVVDDRNGRVVKNRRGREHRDPPDPPADGPAREECARCGSEASEYRDVRGSRWCLFCSTHPEACLDAARVANYSELRTADSLASTMRRAAAAALSAVRRGR